MTVSQAYVANVDYCGTPRRCEDSVLVDFTFERARGETDNSSYLCQGEESPCSLPRWRKRKGEACKASLHRFILGHAPGRDLCDRSTAPSGKSRPASRLSLSSFRRLPQLSFGFKNPAEKHPNSRSLMFGLKYELLYA